MGFLTLPWRVSVPQEMKLTNRRRGRSPFEEVHLVGLNSFAIAEEGEDDAQADAGLGGGGGKDEESEYLAGNIAEDAGEQDEVNVDGVENQLDGHQNDDDVAARHDTDAANQKERQAEEKIVLRRHHGSSVLFLFLAMTTAPTMATSRRTLTISNGSR